MATLKNPLLSQISGKLGNLVIYQVNGKTVVRERPQWKTAYKATELQQLHQQKFKEADRILRPLKQMLDFGFGEFVHGNRKGIHLAMSHAMKWAFDGENGSVEIKPESLLVSSGAVATAANLLVERTGGQKVLLQWESQGNFGASRDSDLSWVIVYNPREGLVEEINGRAFRRTQTQELEVSPRINLSGSLVFMSFYRKLAKEAVRFSDSVCVQLV